MEQSEEKVDENIETTLPYLSSCKSKKDPKKRNSCTESKMLKFIYKNLRYPAKAFKYGVEGTVIIQFAVDTNGDIQDIDIVVGICQEFVDECQRILSKMSSWEAGTQNGKKVKMLYTVPIRYKLQSR